jgi:tricorn protease
VSDFDISPEGKRAVFSARGDVFTAPAKDGSIRNLTRTPGIRETQVAWSPDGRWIAYVSDRSGEDEIYITPQDGLGKEQQITRGYKGFKFAPAWSFDSKKLAWADKDLRLWYVDINDRKPIEVDRGKYGEITNYAWSPDSQWLVYDKSENSGFSVVYLYSLETRNITPATTSMTNSYNGLFDPEGKYLYFLSDRDYNEIVGNIDFEFANPKTTRVYLVTLRKDEPSPFQVLSDEAQIKKEEPAPQATNQASKSDNQAAGKEAAGKEKEKGKEIEKGKEAKPGEKEKPAPFHIDLEGIADRVVALPTDPGVINTLAAGKGFIYYSTKPIAGLSGPIPGETSGVQVYDLKERKNKTLIEGVERFAVSFDGSKLLYEAEGGANGHTYGIIDAKPDGQKKAGDGALNLSGMRVELDPPQEWKQMFEEVWRQERDYFYEASMNGVDWPRVRDKYAALLPYLADRYSLTYILGEMIGELSNSHTYVGGGDYPSIPSVTVGLLGADFEVDSASARYRIKKIYPGENWDSKLRSPLTEPGVHVQEGDYLLAVNGRSLRAPQNLYELFVNTANETVTLTVNSKSSDDGSRTVQVKPIADEFKLRELNMMESNRKKVDAATQGRVGYIYLPDMGDDGLNQFVKQYFPQIRKQGLIFDVRYNGGGFVDPLIFARLRRILAGMNSQRNWESGTVPPQVFNGSLACLTNHFAASDGDIFSYFFKYYQLGPLIGERTWGGVRGIRGFIPLIDGGYISRPEAARYDLNSQWIVENRGVEPDIVVENRPEQVVKGQDPQLEKAIEVVMKDIQAHPKTLPPRPPDLPPYPARPAL